MSHANARTNLFARRLIRLLLLLQSRGAARVRGSSACRRGVRCVTARSGAHVAHSKRVIRGRTCELLRPATQRWNVGEAHSKLVLLPGVLVIIGETLLYI